MIYRSVPALLLTVASAGVATAQDAGTVVATVNGTPITLGQMIAARQGLQDQAGGVPDKALWDMMLENMIRQAAVASAGEAEMDQGDQARIEIERRAYLSARALEKVAETDPTEAEIAAAYDKAFGEVGATTEYSAAHILVKTEAEAQEVAKLLAEGADFARLASEKSIDTASGPNGGALGWFAADQMVAPFAEAVKAMDKGTVSAPVHTDFGWHIIRLDDIRTKDAPELAEVREQVVNQIRREKVEAEVLRLVEGAKVERTEGIDPALMTRTDLLDAK